MSRRKVVTMKEFSAEQTIQAPRQRVWDFMTEPSNMPKWVEGMEKSEVIGGGPMKKGARLRETRTLGGRTETFEIEVALHEPPRHHAGRSTMKGGEFVYEYWLDEPTTNQTHVRLRAQANATKWWAKPFIGFAFRMMKKHDSDQLERLKHALETR